MYDVVIAGLGPAGRLLAARCRDHGLSTLAIDPDPDRRWDQTLALWHDQIPSWLPVDEIVLDSASTVHLRARTEHLVARRYAVIDTAALQAALPLDGIDVEQMGVTDAGLDALRDRARFVVDCRGMRPPAPDRHRPGAVPLQVAYGIVVDVADAAAALAGAEALFMDWRTDYCPDDVPEPSFLYAIPVGDGKVLLEETILATTRTTDPEALEPRLLDRLRGRGLAESALASPHSVERVRFPLRVPGVARPQGVLGFGTAGGYGHSSTGYSIGASLQAADGFALSLAAGEKPAPPRSRSSEALHTIGLRALLALGPEATIELFEAYGRLPTADQRDFVDFDVPARRVFRAMFGMWRRMPRAAQAEMVAATVGGPGTQAAGQ